MRPGLRAWFRARSKSPLVVALVALIAAGALTVLPAGATEPGPVVGRATAPAWTKTKTLTRVFVDAQGRAVPQTTNTVTVTADQTRNLRGRQRVQISWRGAQPSGGRANNPFGETGMHQEYPVVVLQCRGTDDPGLPQRKRVSPSTCWTASVAQRSQITRSPIDALWTRDLKATEADRQRVSGLHPVPAACADTDVAGYWTRLTPFVAKSGKAFPACTSDQMPPEAAVGAAFPPAEVAAFTDGDGNGSVQFEVRSDVENESLGCNHTTACSVVVIPINGLSCSAPATPASPADQACRRGGRFLPGSSNFAGEGVDAAVSPALWWSPSNWENRFSVPITFGLPPDTCDVLDPRPPTAFYGTELLAQAALQWAPAYCLDKERFKFQHNQMSDEAGFSLMEKGGGVAAAVSSQHEQRGQDPVGYAPTAVTGFAIGYVVDRPNNAGELGTLRLNARLLAKLMTQSYLGSDLGRGHPGIQDNPLAIMADPEFIALNPRLSTNVQEAGATLLNLANSSDVVEQLTDYIAHDPDAMAFVNGKADRWGMKVNPAYRKISLPRSEWPLLDEYVPETGDTCRQQNPAAYFGQLAAPVPSMRRIAENLLDAWPNVQTRCDYDLTTLTYKVGRVNRQSYGSRFMLGVVSLGDAARFGLRTAALRTTASRYVAPSDASLTAAVALGEQQGRHRPFLIDQADVRKSGRAYPGTMVVYTAARLRGLPKADAAKVAQFVRVATTEGQRPGSGNGQLPGGFLPLRKEGATAKLFAAAQQVADAVAAQRSEPEPDDPSPSAAPPVGGAPGGDTGGGGGAVPPGVVPSAAEPPTDQVRSMSTPAGPAQPVAMPATVPVGSRLAGGLLPTLLMIGLLGVAVASGIRFVVQPPRRPGA